MFAGEIVVAKLYNWRRAISGKEEFRQIRKNGFRRLQMLCQDESNSPRSYEDRPFRENGRRLGTFCKLGRPYWAAFLCIYGHKNKTSH